MKVERKGQEHHSIPTWLAFLLNNPIRRRFDKSPGKVIDILGINSSTVVLDLGCGPGFYCVPFAKAANRVVAVDIKEEMLKKAEKYAKKSGVIDRVRFIQSDGEQIPSLEGGSCDVAFLSFVYHEFGDSRKGGILSELRRALKAGGRLAIMEYTKRPLMGPHSVDPEKVKKEVIDAGFPEPELVRLSKSVGLIVATIK